MRIKKHVYKIIAASILLPIFLAGCGNNEDGVITITNVSYDPTRELYEEYNAIFEEYYKEQTGEEVKVIQSHGGSGAQARSVVEGASADVVTLALEHDITLIQNTGLIYDDWIDEFPNDSAPYTSVMVFLVRKGNEKNIQDWDDLIQDGVDVITPDPKSSGGACWNFLAGYSYALENFGQEEERLDFMSKLYANVSVMDSGARGATTTFVENGKGDVLIAWENEAMMTIDSYGDEYEIVYPSVSILAKPSVAIVDDNVTMSHTEEVSKAYLDYLYSDEAQYLVAEHGFRPSNQEILSEYSDKFELDIKLYDIEDYGGWDTVYKDYFEDGAIFDEIYQY